MLWAGIPTDGVYATRPALHGHLRAIGRGLPGDDVVDALALAPATGRHGAALRGNGSSMAPYPRLDGGSTWTAANAGLLVESGCLRADD